MATSTAPSEIEVPRRRAARRHVVVVMPAYNAARTLHSTYAEIPPHVVDEVILVDDHSHDDTVGVARALKLRVIAHPHNVGYGGNQKTCYMEALRRGAEVVVMLHPDGHNHPAILASMVDVIRSGQADLVLGSRFLVKGNARQGGMPWWKRLANRFLTWCENLVLGLNLSEYHTGYRAYSRHFLETVPFLRNSNDFVFDTQVLVQAAAFKMRVAEVPVATRYFADASSVNLRVSLVYGLKTMWTLVRLLLDRAGWRWRLLEA